MSETLVGVLGYLAVQNRRKRRVMVFSGLGSLDSFFFSFLFVFFLAFLSVQYVGAYLFPPNCGAMPFGWSDMYLPLTLARVGTRLVPSYSWFSFFFSFLFFFFSLFDSGLGCVIFLVSWVYGPGSEFGYIPLCYDVTLLFDCFFDLPYIYVMAFY